MLIQKGAMFGKLSQLDRFNFKSGAMFGLDARIALAIFGALSVISGAALYSAIQESKAVAVYTTLNEIIKASEAYYLDTGSPLNNLGHPFDLNIGALIENDQSASGWAGPYLNAKRLDDNKILIQIDSQEYTVFMYRHALDDWANGVGQNAIECVSATKGCYEWISIYAYNAELAEKVENLFNILDKKYDNSNGKNTGDIRFREYSATNKRLLFKGFVRGQKDEV